MDFNTIINAIINAFKSTTHRVEQSTTERDDALLERLLVSIMSDGNVSLQLGRYITEDEVDIRREKVSNYIYAK